MELVELGGTYWEPLVSTRLTRRQGSTDGPTALYYYDMIRGYKLTSAVNVVASPHFHGNNPATTTTLFLCLTKKDPKTSQRLEAFQNNMVANDITPEGKGNSNIYIGVHINWVTCGPGLRQNMNVWRAATNK